MNYDTSNISKFHKEQIHYLQQSIWDLEKARTKILFAMGNSELGKIYASSIAEVIENILDDIDSIHTEY